MVTKKLFTYGILLLAGYASLNFLVLLTVFEINDDAYSWIIGGRLDESKARVTDESKANATEDGNSLDDRRFPMYGTAAFSRKCRWAEQNPDIKRNCTILARPLPPYIEGLSNWVAQIVAGRILVRQTGCHLLLDYSYTKGTNKRMNVVNIHEVLKPFANSDSDRPSINWTLPSDYDCDKDRRCFVAQPGYNHRDDTLSKIESAIGVGNLTDTPMYRFGYAMSKTFFLYADEFRDLQLALPGFEVETGMACSLGSVFELAPSASKFEPELFSRILPTLHSKDAFVMSLYIRTGQTDLNTHQEEKGGGMLAPENATIHRKMARKIVRCALHLEKLQLLERSYSRVVWMVVTDSQYLKQWITEVYDTRYSNSSALIVPREVVTTRSRGVHTRSKRGPTTADFAEAMIDWYLIGESDLVVSDDSSVSFGGTATLRTARPLYKPSYYDDSDICSRTILVHDKVAVNQKAKADMRNRKAVTVSSVVTTKNVTVATSQGLSQVANKRGPSWTRGSELEEPRANVTEAGCYVKDRRFPMYGTAAFSVQCPWVVQNPDKERNCTILARPLPPYQEGISNWVAQIVAGRILAQQTGCHLLLDYSYAKGTHKRMHVVNVHEVLKPFANRDSDRPSINWTLPSDYDCDKDRRCFVAQPGYNHRDDTLSKIESAIGVGNLTDTPMYRFGYAMSKTFFLYADEFRDLQLALPGFEVETGMACSLGSVFELAPSASKFEPELFSRILPTLHSKDAFVMSLYIRTGQTDLNTHQEEKGGGMLAPENATIHRKMARKIVRCALHLEKLQLLERSYSRVVWMVVTDSQYLKQWITEVYDTRYSNSSALIVPREVVTTRSRGVHTRSRRGPTTADFAEAMIDWYLIGESDLVVSDDSSVSFGGTATLRTARPLYKPSYHDDSDICSRTILVHTRDNTTVS